MPTSISPLPESARSPADCREAALLCARQARTGIPTHPLAVLGIWLATDLGRHHPLFAGTAFALAALTALVRAVGLHRVSLQADLTPRAFDRLVALPALAANLIYAVVSAAMLAQGLSFAALLVLVGTVALAFGTAMSYASQRELCLGLLAVQLAPPFLAALLMSAPEAHLLTALLTAFAIYMFRTSLLHHDNYWRAVAARNALAEARVRAEQANRAKDQFLANISHEIRTPMNGIVAPAELLRNTQLSDEQRHYLDMIGSSSQVLAQLIDDLLDFSKIEAGKLALHEAPFALTPLLREVASRHDVAATNKGLVISTALPRAEDLWLLGDALRVGQVLDNLLANAVKFTDSGGVALEARVSGDGGRKHVAIAVTDTGPGISPELQPQLFKPFVQADPSSSRRFPGTGLGLSISKRLALAMGGDLTFRSEPGRGTRFDFILHLPVAAPQAEVQNAPAVQRFPGLQVLVAEDNTVNQQVIRGQLQSLGVEPHIVRDGREALAALASAHYDLIILDCQMPGLDGYETARRIRAQGGVLAATPIVALTAHAMSSDRERALASGMNDYLSKPVPLQTLATTLGKWVVPHQPGRARQRQVR